MLDEVVPTNNDTSYKVVLLDFLACWIRSKKFYYKTLITFKTKDDVPVVHMCYTHDLLVLLSSTRFRVFTNIY